MTEIYIASGFLLDLAFGDPAWFPHPVRFIGRLITLLEKALERMAHRRMAGVILLLFTVVPVFLLSRYLASLSPIVEIFLIYTIFATRSLAGEAGKIVSLLGGKDLEGAKKAMSFLVSRDTASMDEGAVARAAVETVSENSVDGVISPMFYLFIGGVPLAMAFKAVSTLDSMVGYKNEKYRDLGWASARMDDMMNFIPARLAAFVLIPPAAWILGFPARRLFRVVQRDRMKHPSPNSGHPEAAFAGALGVRLGGPARYFGKVSEKPFIGDDLSPLDRGKIREAVRLLYGASAVSLITGILLSWSIPWILAAGGIR